MTDLDAAACPSCGLSLLAGPRGEPDAVPEHVSILLGEVPAIVPAGTTAAAAPAAPATEPPRAVTMTPIDVAREAYAAFGRGDLPRVLDLCAEDVDWRYLGPAAAPFSGGFDGRAGVQRFFEAYTGAMRLTAFEPRRFLADGDTVVVLGSESGTVVATGRAVTIEWAHVFVVRDGRIASFREFPDASALDAALRPSG